MIIAIKGKVGSCKSIIANLLHQQLPNSIIVKPNKTYPINLFQLYENIIIDDATEFMINELPNNSILMTLEIK